MKKCIKCQTTEPDDQIRCRYCNTTLIKSEGKDDSFDFMNLSKRQSQPEKNVLRTLRIGDHQYMRYIVGSYFHKRNFFFLYKLSRNDFKMGRRFRRKFIEPITFGVFLRIPWFFINVVDSLIVRSLYRYFCDVCGWKCSKSSKGKGHDPAECEYNQECYHLIKAILLGRIGAEEEQLREESIKKIKKGKKSAFHDLHSKEKQTFWAITDFACLALSLGILASPLIIFLLPLMPSLIEWLG